MDKNQNAVALGKIITEKTKAASRENGKAGGYPKGRTWCQMSEKEAARRKNAERCTNSSCFDCHGDRCG